MSAIRQSLGEVLGVGTSELEGKEILRVVWGEFWKNGLFYSVVAIVVAGVGAYVWWLGVALFVVFAIVGVLSVLQTLVTSLAGAALFPYGLVKGLWGGERAMVEDEMYIGVANVVKVAEDVVMVGWVVFLWFRFFGE